MALPSIDVRSLTADLVGRAPPQSAIYRRYYGRGMDMRAIENALRNAEVGQMADLTDLEAEAMAIDPHLSCIVPKRFGAVDMLPLDWHPAEGEDIDPELASHYCQVIKRLFDRIPDLQAALYSMLWANWNGRGAREVNWYRAAGEDLKLVPIELRFIHPRDLNFGPERELRYCDPWKVRGQFQADGVELRAYPGKFLTWTPQLFNEYPEREGIAPRAMYWAFFKRFSWRMRMLLQELFGIPWRIVKASQPSGVNNPFSADPAELDAAAASVERLGGETTAKLGPGIELDIVTGEGKGEAMSMTSTEVDQQMSKLVLWQTGTTDGAVAGMNSNTVGVQKGEQDILNQRDARGLAARLKCDLVRWIMEINYGAEVAALYTPTPVLNAAPNRDRKTEMDLAERAAKLKVPVAQKQVREIAGLREPEEGEPLVEVAQPPAFPAFGVGDPNPGGESEDEGEPRSEEQKDDREPKRRDGTDDEDETDEEEDEGVKAARILWTESIRRLAAGR